jgi:hypothetical protein
MKIAIACAVVLLLARFCFSVAAFITTFPAAGLLAWAPGRLRGTVAGIVSGLGGVAAAIAFAYLVFRLSLGPTSAFGLLALVTTTISLYFPLRKEFAQSRVFSQEAINFQNAVEAQGHDSSSVQFVDDHATIAVGTRFRVLGAVVGLALSFLWFLLVHGNSV